LNIIVNRPLLRTTQKKDRSEKRCDPEF